MNVTNTWDIPGSHQYRIAPKFPLPRNEQNSKQPKEVLEASHGSSSGHGKEFQCKNERGKWKRNKKKSNGGDNNENHNNFGNSV